jgi:hypothetical protein
MKPDTVDKEGKTRAVAPSGRAFWPLMVLFGCWLVFLLALALLRHFGH